MIQTREHTADAAIKRPKRGFFARVRAFARLFAWLTFAFLVLGAIALRAAYARVLEGSLTIGRELAQLGDVMESTKRLVLNGQTLYVSTAGTEQPVGQVLDRFEKMCGEHAAAMHEELARLSDTLQKELTGGVPSRGLGILREQRGDDEGMVACFANDEGGGAAKVVARVTAALASGDLSKLGKLRYVYATRTKRARTHVVTTWTDGDPMKLGEMFPASGDAAGTDSELVPRPRSSRRLLSAHVDGAPYAVRVYETSLAPETVFAETAEEMGRRGWNEVRAPNGDGTARGFVRGEGVQIVVSAGVADGRTMVTTLELRGGEPTSRTE